MPLSSRDSTDEAVPGADCPDLRDVERTICPGEDGPLAVDRSRPAVAGPDWSLVVAVTNRAADPLGLDPYAWSVFRANARGRRHTGPGAPREPTFALRPAERYAWELTSGVGGPAGADHRVYLDLSPGTYAFAVPLVGGDRLGAVATFDVTD